MYRFQTTAWKYYRINYNLVQYFENFHISYRFLNPVKKYFTSYLHKSFSCKIFNNFHYREDIVFPFFTSIKRKNPWDLHNSLPFLSWDFFLFQCNEFFFPFFPVFSTVSSFPISGAAGRRWQHQPRLWGFSNLSPRRAWADPRDRLRFWPWNE